MADRSLLYQNVTFMGPDGNPIDVPMAQIDELTRGNAANTINYGSQIGACFVMLLVVLTMTPKNRFARVTTSINIAALIVGIIRNVLLSLFWSSSFLQFYAYWSDDYEFVNHNDTRISIAATAFAIPQIVLIYAALITQAWSMMKLWRPSVKWATMGVSIALITVAMGFRIAGFVFQIRLITEIFDIFPLLWVRQAGLALETATISWFCFLFNVRLIIHMWVNRSILPTAKGLSAMEVLVITNGVLMVIPVIFAGLAFFTYDFFEAGSVVYTAVIVLLPLGTLIAQRISTPSAFASAPVDVPSRVSDSTSKQPFLKRWSNSESYGSSPAKSVVHVPGITSRISGGRSSEKFDPIGAELSQIDDLERGVRVDREIEHREERL